MDAKENIFSKITSRFRRKSEEIKNPTPTTEPDLKGEDLSNFLSAYKDIEDYANNMENDPKFSELLESKTEIMSKALAYKKRFGQALYYYISFYTEKKTGINFIDINFEQIKKTLLDKNEDPENLFSNYMLATRALSFFIKHANSEQKEKATKFFDSNPSLLNEYLKNKNTLKYLGPYIAHRLRDNKLYDLGMQILTDTKIEEKERVSLLEEIEEAKYFASTILAPDLLSLIGIKDKKIQSDLINSWKISENKLFPYLQPSIIIRNIDVIKALEEKNPGAVELLYKKFGITHFGRYPVDLLEEQIKQIEENTKPYGVMLSAYDDNNGAFYSDKQKIADFYESLKRLGYGMRIIEARNKFTIARRLLELDRKYGNYQKISFLVINGHGDKDSIQFGRTQFEQPQKFVNITDIDKGARIDKIYKNNIPIAFIACSTGQENGIAQEFSKVIGGNITAPRFETALRNIQASKDENGNLMLDVNFDDFKKGINTKATYSNIKDPT